MTDARPLATPEQTIALAERVADILEGQGLSPVVIGGFALIFHNYPRTTEDLDLGVTTPPPRLAAIRDELDRAGFTTKLRLPDAADPLGGVIDIEDASGAVVQIVNFDNAPAGGFRRAIADAVAAAASPFPGWRLRVVPLPQLIALKLYAGGEDSLRDIRAVLANNPDADVAAIKRLCEVDYRLKSGGVFD